MLQSIPGPANTLTPAALPFDLEDNEPGVAPFFVSGDADGMTQQSFSWQIGGMTASDCFIFGTLQDVQQLFVFGTPSTHVACFYFFLNG